MVKLNLELEPSLGAHKEVSDEEMKLLVESSQAVSLKRIADAMELLAGKDNREGLFDNLLAILRNTE